MYKCPVCGEEARARKDGCCPFCGEEVIIWENYWIQSAIGSPVESFIREFENYVNTSFGDLKINWHIPRKSAQYKRNAGIASQMIKLADGDFTLAIEALKVFFTNDKFNWRNPTSLIQLRSDYPLALAIAKKQKEIREDREERSRETVDNLLEREDIFNV